MSRVLTLALALVVLAIFQAAVAALVVALAIMLLFYLATRPRETLIFLGTLLVFGLASARPVAFIVTAGIVGLAVANKKTSWKPRHQSLRLGHGVPR